MDFLIVQFANGLAARTQVSIFVSVALATGLIFVLAGVALLVWWRMDTRRRIGVLRVLVATVVIAYSASQLIGVVAFRVRPYVTHPDVHALIANVLTTKSFPSDHATIAFAIVFAFLPFLGRWGRVSFLFMASAVAFGRVLVGVHYPSDVVAGALLAYVVARIVGWMQRRSGSDVQKISPPIGESSG